MKPMLFHCKHYISEDQHGFVSGRSTTTNLLCLTSHIADSFAGRAQTDVIYTDLTAAFDKINHAITVAKLERLGVGGLMLRWFSSYLTDRRLTVELAGFSSESFTATSGVPQGSHLGPLIFLLYFNDVNTVIKGPRLSYADDLKLFLRVRTIADAVALQHDLDVFVVWCDMNRLTVNPEKCSIISFSRKLQPILFCYQLKGKVLQRVEDVKDLGVILDAQLTFKHHLSYVIEKASRTLGFIFRIAKDFTDPYCLKSLYCSLVRATLEYCSAVWHPYYRNGVERIESVQRRFIRYALRRLPWRDPFRLPSYQSRCQLIQLESLQTRRDVNRAMVVADLLSGRIDCPALLESINASAHSRTLRNNAMLRLPLRRTNYGQNSAMVGLQRVFNRVAEGFDFHLSRQVIRRNYVEILSRLSV